MKKVTNAKVDINLETSKEKRIKQSRKKYLSNGFAIRMAQLNPKSPLVSSYWRTYHCRDIIEIEEGVTRSSFCKNRWCLQCQSIRTATMINRYSKSISLWSNPYFLTLTAPTVSVHELPERIADFAKKWRAIAKSLAKTKITCKGIRKAECTARPSNRYHYHFHILCENFEGANYIYQRWLDLNPSSSTLANDIRPADDGSVIELFKYMTKLVSKANSKDQYTATAYQLDQIFNALRYRRVWQGFGGIEISEDIEVRSDIVVGLSDGAYTWEWFNWINKNTGELYSEFEPDQDDYELTQTIKR